MKRQALPVGGFPALILAMVLAIGPAVAVAQSMGGNMGGPEANPANPMPPANPESAPVQPGENGTDDNGDLGPFHRPAPPEGPEDSRASYAEAMEMLGFAMGLDGEARTTFRDILTAANSDAKRVQAEAAERTKRAQEGQMPALKAALPADKFEKLTRVIQLIEQYKSAIGRLRAAAEANPAARDELQKQLQQINETVDESYRRILGAERAAEFITVWHQIRYRELNDREFPHAISILGHALGLDADTHEKFVEILVGARTEVARAQQGVALQTEAIKARQLKQLQELLGPDDFERLVFFFRVIEGYKAARADLERAAQQPGVNPAELGAQQRKIDEAVEAQFKELVPADRFERFMEFWYRIAQDGLRDQ